MIGKQNIPIYPTRRRVLISIFILAMNVLIWRVVDLQIFSHDFLRQHGEARSVRVVPVTAHRGVIVDRNYEPLAISTPVESVWAEPNKVLSNRTNLPQLAEILGTDKDSLTQALSYRLGREFVYLKRHMTPDQAATIQALSIPGIHLQREYKRYYPAAEVTAHIIGFTNVDDVGQEGLELAFDQWLQGSPGSKRVLKDRLGRTVQDIESIRSTNPGKQLVLSIDKRVQYLAYRELKAAVSYHKARSGSLVMLDTKTGEVMAMLGQPSYNPNNRSGLKSEYFRNRAVTDVFEPGSTMKPFTITAALLSGMYTPGSNIETQPGYYKVSGHTISDARNYGKINVANVIRKSSNVGASKIALSLGPQKISELMAIVGFGQSTSSGFPGESSGLLNDYHHWSELELATIAFGYGVSVTTLQLVHAYSIIAAGGISRPISFLKVEKSEYARRVLPEVIAAQVKDMLEAVTVKGGTGWRARVEGYRIAGKTGTVHKSTVGGYAEDSYLSLFAGFAPAGSPRLALVVVIDEPQGDQYFGGQVAAPVFSRVMEGALRLLNIQPDDLPSMSGKMILAQQKMDGI